MNKVITILFVGEIGVGKSTFINAFANYLLFNNMKDAIQNIKCLIPTKFTVFDKKDRKLKDVFFGQPYPEDEGAGTSQSSTQNCRCYKLNIEGFTLNLIDTPGIEESGYHIQIRNLLSFISQYQEINAICVLLKPNNAKVNVMVKNCILPILIHLNKSNDNDIIFVFTNASSTSYQTGNTIPELMKNLDKVKSKPPFVEIEFNENTTYCFDNEVFIYLVTMRDNILLDGVCQTDFENMWQKSVAESRRLLRLIKGNKFKLVQDTVYSNDIREKITKLETSKPIQRLKEGMGNNLTDKKIITILLLGESGVGKSTFINAFVNYLLFDSMKDAEQNMKCLIPTIFTVFDMKDRKLKEVAFGQPDPKNEGTDSTQSGTKNCRCYAFKLGDITLKIIDTPGIGDTSGVAKDNINMRNLLSFISQYREIDAICVLLKPNNAKVSVVFKYCILQILAHLNKSASENIVFLFTNARGTFYQPGDSAPALMKILDQVKSKPPNVEIKFNENTIYCLDNEAFRYLVAVSEPNHIQFDERFQKDFEESWTRSVEGYITSLKPHLVQDTISINNIRQKIILLQRPIGDITKNISDEINECEIRKKKIHEFVGDIAELKKELYIPTLDIVSTPLEEPMTVCIDPKCREEKIINGEKKVHYKVICHYPCYLEQSDGNIVGNSGLLDCKAFNKYISKGDFKWFDQNDLVPDNKLNKDGSQVWAKTVSERTKSETCFKCGHSFHTHLHTTYETKIISKKIRDEFKFERITNQKELVKSQKLMIRKIEERIAELNNELKIITDISVEFACFLKNNAIATFNDALEDYIKYLIENQRSGLMFEGDTDQSVETLQNMLIQYQNEKKIIMNAIKNKAIKNDRISSEKINEKITKLFNLKIYGRVIKNHFETQKLCEASIHNHSKENEINIKPENRSKSGSIFNGIKKWYRNM